MKTLKIVGLAAVTVPALLSASMVFADGLPPGSWAVSCDLESARAQNGYFAAWCQESNPASRLAADPAAQAGTIEDGEAAAAFLDVSVPQLAAIPRRGRRP